MKIYVIVTEAKVHTYTSWGRATQVSRRAVAMFPMREPGAFIVVQTIASKRKATKTDKELMSDHMDKWCGAQEWTCGAWTVQSYAPLAEDHEADVESDRAAEVTP